MNVVVRVRLTLNNVHLKVDKGSIGWLGDLMFWCLRCGAPENEANLMALRDEFSEILLVLDHILRVIHLKSMIENSGENIL